MAGALLALATPTSRAAPSEADGQAVALDPARISTIRPDFHAYIRDLRPLEEKGAARIYMALVRPGATDATRRESAPFTGSGARNDILYDTTSLGGNRSAAWSLLLLDHEYFHARHLAGTTSLPLPGTGRPEIERHFCEAAAWGFNVGEARAGRYPGLRPVEFREALDRYGEHYAALRTLLETDATSWKILSDLLRRPAGLLTSDRAPRAEAPAHPSGRDRSPETP